MAKKKAAGLLPKLTEMEQDLLSRRLKDNEVIRQLSANRNTIKAMEQQGLISPGKGRDPLTIAWRLKRNLFEEICTDAPNFAGTRLRGRFSILICRETDHLQIAH